MTDRARRWRAGVLAAACCVGPTAVLVVGGTAAVTTYLLWPGVALVVVLATALVVSRLRQAR